MNALIVLVIVLATILGISIGYPIGQYKAECEFGEMLYLLEKSGQLKLKEVKGDEKNS